MKEIKNILLLSFVLLIFSSCEELYNSRSGQEIHFRASSGNDTKTRTSYSGEVKSGKERIDWVSGDEVKIYLYLDNAPGYTFSNTSSDYEVALLGEGDQKYISKGTLKAVDGTTTLKWVGEENDGVGHRFYSIYPAGYDGELSEVDGKIKVKFTGLATQTAGASPMDYAYMAAVAPKVYTVKDVADRIVDLNYYPMVTTLYVKLVNESSESLMPTVKIEAKEGTTPLAGPFSVWLDGDEVFRPEVEISSESSDFVRILERTVSVPGNDEKEAIFFLLPIDYEGKNITLSLEGGTKTSKWNLKEDVDLESLVAFNKYNVTIKIDKDGNFTLHDFSDGGMQMLLLYLNGMGGGKVKDYFDELHPGFDFWRWWNNDYLDYINGNNGKSFAGVTAAEVLEEFKDILDVLQAIIDDVTYLELTNVGSTGGPSRSIFEKDFQIFPKLEKIYLEMSTNADSTSVSIGNLPHLSSVTVNHPRKVYFKNCPELKTVQFENMDDKTKEIFFDNCGLTSFSSSSSSASNTVFEFKNMEELTTVYVERAEKIIAYNCRVLKTIDASPNYGAKPPVDVQLCPLYEGYY